jgi:hypothetical protein
VTSESEAGLTVWAGGSIAVRALGIQGASDTRVIRSDPFAIQRRHRLGAGTILETAVVPETAPHVVLGWKLVEGILPEGATVRWIDGHGEQARLSLDVRRAPCSLIATADGISQATLVEPDADKELARAERVAAHIAERETIVRPALPFSGPPRYGIRLVHSLIDERARGMDRAGLVVARLESGGPAVVPERDAVSVGLALAGLGYTAEAGDLLGGLRARSERDYDSEGLQKLARTLTDWTGQVRLRARSERAGKGSVPLAPQPDPIVLDSVGFSDSVPSLSRWAEQARYLIYGVLGARPDARFGRLRLAPTLPEAWPAASIGPIHLRDASVHLEYRHRDDWYEFRLHQLAGGLPVNVIFEPRLPVRGVSETQVDGSPADLAVEAVGARLAVALQFPLDSPRTLRVRGPRSDRR